MRFDRLSTVLETVDHTRFHRDWQLFTWHPRDVLDDELADEILCVIESEELFYDRPFNRYTDFSQLDSIRLKIGHAFNIAERRRDVLQDVKSAFFATTTVGLGVARLYEALMKDAHIQVRAFSDRAAAAEWLAVPPSILLPD